MLISVKTAQPISIVCVCGGGGGWGWVGGVGGFVCGGWGVCGCVCVCVKLILRQLQKCGEKYLHILTGGEKRNPESK